MEFNEISQEIHQLNSSIGGEWDSHWQLLWIYEEMGELSRELQKRQKLPAKLHDDSSQKIQEGIIEEFGDILFGLVSLAKSLDIDPIEALRYSLQKFQKRYSND